MKTLLLLVMAIMGVGCAIRIDSSDVIEQGGTSVAGSVNTQYVAVSSFGTGVAYQTGSNLSASPNPRHLNGPISVVSDRSSIASISVNGPALVAGETATLTSLGLAIAKAWYPATFTDEFQITVELIENGPEQFGDAFIFARSPWPMAFRARYDQVGSHDDRIEFASTLTHEGYHLANAVQQTGLYLPEFTHRPDAGHIYEETAAHLLEACVASKLEGVVDLLRNPTVSITQIDADTGLQQEVSAPFRRSFIEAMTIKLDQPHNRNSFPKAALYIGFYRTLFHHYADGADIIEPGTPAAERLLEACDRLGPDVSQVPVELRRVAAEMAATQTAPTSALP